MFFKKSWNKILNKPVYEKKKKYNSVITIHTKFFPQDLPLSAVDYYVVLPSTL